MKGSLKHLPKLKDLMKLMVKDLETKKVTNLLIHLVKVKVKHLLLLKLIKKGKVMDLNLVTNLEIAKLIDLPIRLVKEKQIKKEIDLLIEKARDLQMDLNLQKVMVKHLA